MYLPIIEHNESMKALSILLACIVRNIYGNYGKLQPDNQHNIYTPTKFSNHKYTLIKQSF